MSKFKCNPPYSCFACPYPDCTMDVTKVHMTAEEKRFAAEANYSQNDEAKQARRRYAKKKGAKA